MTISDNWHVHPGRDCCHLTPAPWWQFAPPAPAQPATGWQCPRCEKIHSPSVLSCSCTDSLRNRIGRGMATGGA